MNNNNNEDPSTTATSSTTRTQHEQQQTTARQFMDFLPTFYESVLELLTKERTQSKLVFGPELSPMIVTRVLIEVFKPLVPSFQKRLEKLCPLPGKIGSSSSSLIRGGTTDGSSSVGGTEAIATAYESTIQFLSLAYDQMETWNGGGGSSSSNQEESSGSRKDNKTRKGKSSSSSTSQQDGSTKVEEESIQSSIRSAILLIASPFLPYQRALAVAERDPMGEAASMVAKDVRSVINFEDAAERLGDLAPFMFPLAEG